ncbi:MAG: response regulator [Gammaproteobacteria bacterium]
MDDTTTSQVDGKRNKSVLVVDDHELVLKMVVSMLVKEGFTVRSASSGQEALDIARNDNSVQCVLQDLSMPLMSGEEVIEELAGFRPELPVLVYSADEESAVAHRLVHLGIAGYLQKPFDPEELVERLTVLLGD